MASRKHTTPAQLDLSFDPAEEWRDIPGYEGLYQVSSLGRVRSLDTPSVIGSRTRTKQGRMLRLLSRKKKYLAVRLSKRGEIRTLNVHALVLTAFVGPRPEGLTCNHIDGNSLNNVVGNLEWVTSQENMRHAHALNLIVPFLPRGARNAMTKLTDAEVMEIRRLYAEGMRNKDLSRQFSVSPGNISMIVHRRKWTHLP
jgi:hypothetical protein